MTHLFAPPRRPADSPALCVVCGRAFVDGPLLEWDMCSPECANADRNQRFIAALPDCPEDDSQAWVDFREEQRQRAREVLLQEALLVRWQALTGRGFVLDDSHWLALAEADLGHHEGAGIARRINELVELYGPRLSRDPTAARLTLSQVRARLWQFVPAKAMGGVR